MSHDYNREDIEIEIEMNNEMIQRLENRLNKSHELEESEEPEILRQLQELKDANEELMQLLEEEFGETLESTLDPKHPDYDPDFARIYEKQQKGLKEIEDQEEDYPENVDDDLLKLDDDLDLSKYKIISKKFAEEDSQLYKPSVSYNPLVEAIKGNHQDWEGASRGDYEAMLSDIKEFVDRFDLLLKSDTPESKAKARKLYGILREYTLSEKFPWALAVKKFPILNDVPVLSFAEDRGILEAQKKYRVDKTLERIQSLLKQQGISSEQKKELKAKESALKEMSKKLVEFAEEEYKPQDWFDAPISAEDVIKQKPKLEGPLVTKKEKDDAWFRRDKYLREMYAKRAREEILKQRENEPDEEDELEREEELKQKKQQQKELEEQEERLNKKLELRRQQEESKSLPLKKEQMPKLVPESKKQEEKEIDWGAGFSEYDEFAETVAVPKRIWAKVDKNPELKQELALTIRELRRALKSSKNPETVRNGINGLISEGYPLEQIAFEIPEFKIMRNEVKFGESSFEEEEKINWDALYKVFKSNEKGPTKEENLAKLKKKYEQWKYRQSNPEPFLIDEERDKRLEEAENEQYQKQAKDIRGKIGAQKRIPKARGQFDDPEIKQKFKDVERQIKSWLRADNVQYYYLQLLNKFGYTLPELFKIAPDLKKHLEIRDFKFSEYRNKY